MYSNAITAIQSYATIDYEGGLVGKLLKEERTETGNYGEIEALERLTMCLIKLKRADEAAQQMETYFKIYAGDLNRAAAPRIKKRIEKALKKPLKKLRKYNKNRKKEKKLNHKLTKLE